jgi:hypothetical protein
MQEELVAPNKTTYNRKDVTQRAPNSLRELLKKYQLCTVVPLKMPTTIAGGNVTMIKIRDLFGYTDILSKPVPPTTYRANNGLFTHYQLLYRQFKGPLRFKMMLNDVPVNYAFSVFYQPPVTEEFSNDATIKLAVANSLYLPPQPIPTGYNMTTSTTRAPNLMRLPVTYINGVQKTAEFEIPYSSKFHSILSWTGSASENELASSLLTDLGYLFIYNQATQFTTSTATEVNLHMFMALGDESRFGNLFQIPSVAVNSIVDSTGKSISSVWPDSYGTGSPISNTLVRF